MKYRVSGVRRLSVLLALGCTLAMPQAFGKEQAKEEQAKQSIIRSYDPTQVTQVQCYLYKHGHTDVGPIDGLYGPLTTKAVTDFQRDNRLVATGKLDNETLGALTATGGSRGVAGEESPSPAEPKSH
jgi:peptidoglycan hydrolase-like protein with peptidoglycan-binding domain